MFHKRCTHLLQPLKCWVASLFYNLIRSVVKCVWLAVHNGTTWLKTTLSLSPLLGYFISSLNSCDSSSSDRVWLVFTTSSANPDTWFHWGRWDLKGGGHGSPSPLLRVIWFTVPAKPGVKNASVSGPSFCGPVSLSFCLLCWQTCFFSLLFLPWGGLRFLSTSCTCRSVQSYKHLPVHLSVSLLLFL